LYGHQRRAAGVGSASWLETLEEGRVSGLNGVLLAAAAEAGLEGACLLGEMPHIFAQLPFPKASLAVLRAFSKLAEVEVDLGELEEQTDAVGKKLGVLLAQVEQNPSRSNSRKRVRRRKKMNTACWPTRKNDSAR